MINGKTGAAGMALLLALSRIFTEAAALPGESAGYGMQRFTVLVLSFVLTAAVYLPLIGFISSSPGVTPLGAVAARSKLLSGFFGVIFSVFLLSGAAETGLRAYYYASSTAFDSAPPIYFYAFTGAALLFTAYCGLEAASRAGFITAGVFALLILLIILALAPSVRTERLYPALTDRSETLWSEILHEFSLNAEYLIFAALCGRINRRRSFTVPAYIGISFAAVLAMTFLYTTVLGRLTNRLMFPFYTLSSISDITLLHRINGIDIAVWAAAGILRLALFAFAFGEVVKECFAGGRDVKPAVYAFCAAALTVSALFCSYPELHEPVKRISGSGIPLSAAAILLPAAAFLCTRSGKGASE